MKLVQYRFSPDDVARSKEISQEIRSFLVRVDELVMTAAYSSRNSSGATTFRNIFLSDIENILASSFEQSFKEIIDLEKYASVKSNKSCRFIVFEDDGLVRICYATEDIPIEFGSFSLKIEDVSQLLIKTDLFDFI